MKREHTELPWINSYPPGIHWDAQLPVLPVPRLLDDSAEKWPELTAVDFMGKQITYRELQDLVNRAAFGFQQLGVKPGVHVGLYLPNTPHYIISFFGVLKAGGTVVNYSPLDAERVLEHKVEDSETDIIVTLDLEILYPQMDRLLSGTRLKKLVIGNIPEMSASLESINSTAQALQRVRDIPKDERHITFASLTDNTGVFNPSSIGNLHEEIAVLQYTGGTTGLPKGAMLTHANLTSAASQIHTINGGQPAVLDEGRESVLAVLPMFHIYALSVNMLFAVRMGAKIVLHIKFELEAVLKDLTEKKITVFPGVPTMFTAIVNSSEIDKYDLTSLKLCNSGGAPLPVEVGRRFQDLTGTRVVEGWGMTETSATGTFTPQYGLRRTGSCGIPVAGVTLKFVDVDDATREVARGERGELCIKGPNVMRGYWKKSEATAASMTPDGFFRTGDVAWMDEDGFVYIVDRTKDMILCGGFNVYPRVIEEVIYEHPAVAEVSVIGVPDAYRGESPKAFVVLKPDADAFSLEELQTFLKGRLGKHEMVQMLEIRSHLPKTPVGKLSKKELYDEEERRRQAM